ncbi:hypothetical protein [Yinghuangia sp. YIM S10712]|uniref:hypothetical protein n=1 Tax=Yinghuangia sp. YIM S10712 TaxID=3436930 RepID=UPI003F53D4C4
MRAYGGWVVALVGAVLCVVGWYGVSGEKHEGRQIPYLASATVPGAALIVAGAVLVAGRLYGGGADESLRRQVAELHALVVEPVEPGDGAEAETVPVPATGEEPLGGATRAPDTPFVALPAGARYHRPECALVVGKKGVHPVGPARAAELDLRPCALCDPDDTGDTPAAPGASGPPDFDVD